MPPDTVCVICQWKFSRVDMIYHELLISVNTDFTIDDFWDALEKSIVNYIPIYLLRCRIHADFENRKIP